MALEDYFRILRRRGWIIVLVMVMTAASAFAFSKLQAPVYKSSVEILVQPARADFGLTQSAKILLRSYVSWMNTDTRAQDVIDLLQLDMEPGPLRGDVTIASDESRLVIQINVEDQDGELANRIAQAWTDTFIQWRNAENTKQRKEDRVEAFQLDPPRYSLARPKWKINVLAGAIFGALIGGVIVFVLEWIESGVVRRPEDVERYLGVSLLGAIPAPKLDVSRPYLLGGWSDRPASLPAPTSVPQLASPKSEPPVTPQAPATTSPPQPAKEDEPDSPPASPELEEPQEPKVAKLSPPAPSPGNDEVGPIEPTILHSKGDEL